MNFSNLKNCMDSLGKRYNVPGATCIVAKNHEALFKYCVGMKDVENNIKMKGDELYFIFSMTKLITCTAALQLYERGIFSLSDPLSLYMPEFERMKVSGCDFDPESASGITTGASLGEASCVHSGGYAKNPITIRHLFTMCGGFDYALDDEVLTSAKKAGKSSTRELVSAMAGKILGFEPGTRFRYSLCHDIVGALIEIWSGKKLGEYMKEFIFDPLGMKNTFFGVPKDKERLGKMASRYSMPDNTKLIKEKLECCYNLSDEYESGGAGLVSCADDYVLITDALACGGMGKSGKRILSPAAIELMRTNQLKGKALEDFHLLRAGYGYGLGVRTHMDKAESGSLSPYGEFGWDGAAGAFNMIDAENRLSFVYFQHSHNWVPKMHDELRNALYSCIE